MPCDLRATAERIETRCDALEALGAILGQALYSGQALRCCAEGIEALIADQAADLRRLAEEVRER